MMFVFVCVYVYVTHICLDLRYAATHCCLLIGIIRTSSFVGTAKSGHRNSNR